MTTRSLTIGEFANRAGVSQSALRFYESRGLISSERTAGGQRRYDAAALRRVAVIQAAQRVGISLNEIAREFERLPQNRSPNKAEWAKLSRSWRSKLDQQLETLSALREDLDGCIGCGCLSLQRCRLYNPGDGAAAEGPGARKFRG